LPIVGKNLPKWHAAIPLYRRGAVVEAIREKIKAKKNPAKLLGFNK